MTYTFEQLKNALLEYTTFDLEIKIDEYDEQGYALIDGFGDQDGDLFYDLDDIADYICNNEEIDAYLATL